MGAMSALLLRGAIGLPGTEEPEPPAKQQYTPRPQTQQYEGAAQPKEDAPQQREATYVTKVGEIQANSVETFLDSHDRLL